MTSSADVSASAAPSTLRRLLRPSSIGGWLVWGMIAVFFVAMFALIFTVFLDSIATTWFGSWLPDDFTTHWYGDAWAEFDLANVLLVTGQVAVAVVAISTLIGVPAAYALARRDFPGKRIVTVLFLLPILIPPITYGIPLATVLYKVQLAGSLFGVIVANLVPTVPFVVLVMIPFIEQIDPKIEAAARMCGAGTMTIFFRIVGPLLVPGILAAGVLVLVRTVGMFELTFLTSGPSSSTIVVVLYGAVFGAGIRAPQEVDAMAVLYTASMLVLLVTALRFVNPTQLVTRVGGR
ncbi:MAG TPA: ABC transporter permease [Terriglobales bacterium]|nr:ABC transporter permease [Terriglobales bacterium]